MPGLALRVCQVWQTSVALVLLLGCPVTIVAQSPPPASGEDEEAEQGALEELPFEEAEGESASADLEDELKAVEVVDQHVDGALEKTPVRVERIQGEDLVRRGATDLATALSWLSGGADISPTGTAQGLIVDGLPSSQVIILRDGLPISRLNGSPSGPLIDLSAIPIDPSTIERIDVYRGAGPVGSGAAGGIIIDIVTRQGATPTNVFARSQISAQPDAALTRQDYSVGADVPVGSQFQSTALVQGSLSEPLDANLDEVPDTPDRERISGELALTWRPARLKHSHLRASLIGSRQRTLSLGGPTAQLDDQITQQDLRARLQGRWWPVDGLRLDHGTDLSDYDHRFHKMVRSSGFERLKAKTRQQTARQFVAATWLQDEHVLAVELNGGLLAVERQGETGDLTPVSEGDLGLGVTETWFVTQAWELYGRGFVSQHSDFGTGFNVQVGTAVSPWSWLTLRSSLSRSERRPTPEERFLFFDHSEVGYRVQGNPDLQPEQLQSVRAGVVMTGAEATVGMEVEGFYHRLNNVIVTESDPDDPSLFSYFNRDRAHAAGLNASLQWRRIPGGLSWLGGVTWLPISHDLETGQRLPLRHVASTRTELRGSWLGGGLEAWADASLQSARSVPEGSVAAPGYMLLGGGVGGRVAPYTRVMLDANNLLDQTNATWGPMAGFNLMFTLEVNAARR